MPKRESARWQRAAVPISALLGGGLMAAAGVAPWFHRLYRGRSTGPVEVQLTGSDVFAGLVALALVVLAGWAAASLTRGIVRRIIGGIMALVGVVTVLGATMATAGDPADQLAGQLQWPAAPVAASVRDVIGPVCGVLGGVLALVAGVLILAGRQRGRRASTRYDTPAAQRAALRRIERRGRAAAPGDTAFGAAAGDASDWWRALDEGIDPTTDDDR